MGLYLGQNLQTDWPLSCLFLLCDRLVDQSTLRKSVKNVSAWNTFFFSQSNIVLHPPVFHCTELHTQETRHSFKVIFWPPALVFTFLQFLAHQLLYSIHQLPFTNFVCHLALGRFIIIIPFFFSVRKTAARCLWKQGRLEPQAWTSCDPKSKITRC